jgi:hypothetical protein
MENKTAEELSRRLGNSNFYHRFSVDSGLESVSMTSWTEADQGEITSHTKTYMEKASSSLSAVVELTIKNEGLVTLGKLSKCFSSPKYLY